MTTTCPYCNAFVSAPAAAPANGRLRCDRCQEEFPYRPADNGAVPPHPSAFAPSPAAEPRRRLNRWIGLGVLVVMILMASGALMLSLHTVDKRRGNDPREPMGYLPDDTNVIGFVDVNQVYRQPGGPEFLNQLRLGPTEFGLATLESWVGIKKEEFDQVLVGLKVGPELIPRFTLVLQTRHPYDAEKLRHYLPAVEEVESHGKRLLRFNVPQGPAGLSVWCPAETVLILGLSPEDLEPVPERPRVGIDHLPEPVRDFLHDRLRPHTQAWAAGHADRWDQTGVWPLLGKWLADKAPVFAGVQTWGFGVQLDDPKTTVYGVCRCKDDPAAAALAKLWPDSSRDGNWVTVQFQSEAGVVPKK